MKREWKRKLKKIKAKNPLLLFLLLTICTISIMTAGYALLKSELTLNGDANIGDGSSGGGSSGEVKDPEDMTAACVTDITYDIKNSWSNVYQVSLTITNNSDAAIHSWQIKLLNSKNVEIQLDKDLSEWYSIRVTKKKLSASHLIGQVTGAG